MNRSFDRRRRPFDFNSHLATVGLIVCVAIGALIAEAITDPATMAKLEHRVSAVIDPGARAVTWLPTRPACVAGVLDHSPKDACK